MKNKIKTFEILSMFSIIFLIGLAEEVMSFWRNYNSNSYSTTGEHFQVVQQQTSQFKILYRKHLDLDREFYVYVPTDLNSPNTYEP